jgi:hypothetical protein
MLTISKDDGGYSIPIPAPYKFKRPRGRAGPHLTPSWASPNNINRAEPSQSGSLPGQASTATPPLDNLVETVTRTVLQILQEERAQCSTTNCNEEEGGVEKCETTN